jgi:hypothetical protein
VSIVSLITIAKFVIKDYLYQRYEACFSLHTRQELESIDYCDEDSVFLQFEVYDSMFCFTILLYFLLVLKMKKSEDYIAACSNLKTLNIVSIH